MGNQNLTILPSTTVTSAGSQSVPLDVSLLDELAVYLIVTAASGTSPSLTITIQDSPDGTNWVDVYSFPAATAASVLRAGWQDLKFCVGRYLRVRWQVSGTSPSFTFAVNVVPASAN